MVGCKIREGFYLDQLHIRGNGSRGSYVARCVHVVNSHCLCREQSGGATVLPLETLCTYLLHHTGGENCYELLVASC